MGGANVRHSRGAAGLTGPLRTRRLVTMRRSRLLAAVLCSVALHLAAGFWLWPSLRSRPPPDSVPVTAPSGGTLAWADFELAAPASPPHAQAPRVVPQIRKNPPRPSASNDALAPAVSDNGPLAAEARRLMESNQTGEAMVTLKLCLEADLKNAECHLMLGKVYASRDDYEGEALEYRAFLRYASAGHPARWWVKEILAEHDWTDEGIAAFRASRRKLGPR